MTRANLTVKEARGRTHLLHWGSDAHPEEKMMSFLFCLAGQKAIPEVPYFAENNPAGALWLGWVGNPYYYYEVVIGKSVRAWKSQMFWVNAPDDWEKRGWICWQGKNGKFGYTSFRKGKLVEHHELLCRGKWKTIKTQKELRPQDGSRFERSVESGKQTTRG